MHYKLSFSILTAVLTCSWVFSAYCFHHTSNTSSHKTFTIACPVVKNQLLTSGEILNYEGHQWRVELTNFAEDAISSVEPHCSDSDSAKKKVVALKSSTKMPSTTQQKTEPTVISTCQATIKNSDDIIDGQVKARKVKINTVNNMTYTCYSSLVNQNRIYCQGFMKPERQKGEIDLTKVQFESEVQFRFILVHKNNISCDCSNTTLTCKRSLPKGVSADLPS